MSDQTPQAPIALLTVDEAGSQVTLMDKGPWTRLYNDADECVGIISDDFEHDVALRVSGDFTNREEFKAYCDWLAAELNSRVEQRSARVAHNHEVEGSNPSSATTSSDQP